MILLSKIGNLKAFSMFLGLVKYQEKSYNILCLLDEGVAKICNKFEYLPIRPIHQVVNFFPLRQKANSVFKFFSNAILSSSKNEKHCQDFSVAFLLSKKILSVFCQFSIRIDLHIKI